MSCDTLYDRCNINMFNGELDPILEACVQYDAHQVIIGGDFNTDFKRRNSLHSIDLCRYLETKFMKSCTDHVLNDVESTSFSCKQWVYVLLQPQLHTKRRWSLTASTLHATSCCFFTVYA